MADQTIPDWHECSFYCHDDIHCTRALSTSSETAEGMILLCRYHCLGADFLSAREAREADVTLWKSVGGWAARATERETKPWLIFFRFNNTYQAQDL